SRIDTDCERSFRAGQPGRETKSCPGWSSDQPKITEDNQMSFSVVTNTAALNGQAQLDKTNMGLQNTLARLTSGLRINSAADDAAGLAVANRFRMDNAGLQTGVRSANDAISRLQIEDGAMSSISSLLDRALTLSAQAA